MDQLTQQAKDLLKIKIQAKLKNEYSYDDSDDVLLEYSLMLLKHNKSKEQIIDDLASFLKDECPGFVNWMWQEMESLVETPPSPSLTGTKRDLSEMEQTHITETEPSPKRQKIDSQEELRLKREKRRLKFKDAFSQMENSPKTVHSKISSRKSTEFKQRNRASNPNAISPPGSPVHNPSNAQSSASRCKFFPNCNKDDCPYFHPTEPCRNFPKCPYGDNCRYVHPKIDCKFGAKCLNVNCVFTHPERNNTPCKKGFSCKNRTTGCNFKHPQELCKFGFMCKRKDNCFYSHARPCKYGATCHTIDCKFAHTIVPEATAEDIQTLSVSLPATPPSTPPTVPLATSPATIEQVVEEAVINV
eukprot:TRINITY_DN9276_c0_g1_i1.p1 TRINITY_DN9276_c0_g1~~TRINITY_DN9276_c0_g1_i1.p1  ORF type:complete len:365 (-),score=67.63 TRINITY_DN9276_c0_g1_i1:16-1089(-)